MTETKAAAAAAAAATAAACHWTVCKASGQPAFVNIQRDGTPIDVAFRDGPEPTAARKPVPFHRASQVATGRRVLYPGSQRKKATDGKATKISRASLETYTCSSRNVTIVGLAEMLSRPPTAEYKAAEAEYRTSPTKVAFPWHQRQFIESLAKTLSSDAVVQLCKVNAYFCQVAMPLLDQRQSDCLFKYGIWYTGKDEKKQPPLRVCLAGHVIQSGEFSGFLGGSRKKSGDDDDFNDEEDASEDASRELGDQAIVLRDDVVEKREWDFISLGNNYYYSWNSYGFARVWKATSLSDPYRGLANGPSSKTVRLPCSFYKIAYVVMNMCVGVADVSLINSKLLDPRSQADLHVTRVDSCDAISGKENDRFGFLVQVAKLSTHLARMTNDHIKRVKDYQQSLGDDMTLSDDAKSKAWSEFVSHFDAWPLRFDLTLSCNRKTWEYVIEMVPKKGLAGNTLGKRKRGGLTPPFTPQGAT